MWLELSKENYNLGPNIMAMFCLSVQVWFPTSKMGVKIQYNRLVKKLVVDVFL